jgi:MOSC domain-containing protein YiiM
MQLISVNIGQPRIIQKAKASGVTGIYKLPARDPVRVTRDGLEGDTISDTKNHGGVDQAVYVYTTPDYAWWGETLGLELSPGVFGENLTVTDVESTQLNIGDYLHAGSVTLQVSAPRIPCVTLAARMGDPLFVKRFMKAERPGVYCRVVQEGWVQAGDTVTLERYEGDSLPAIELFRCFYAPDMSEATLRRHLAAPIAVRDRIDKEARLARMLE